MKIQEIKRISEQLDLETLKQLEIDVLNQNPLKIEIHGEDEGEILTHVSAAIWIKEKSIADKISIQEALRAYTQRVRKSIG